MEKPDTHETRHIRLKITKNIAPGVVVTIEYEGAKDVLEKLDAFGINGKVYLADTATSLNDIRRQKKLEKINLVGDKADKE